MRKVLDGMKRLISHYVEQWMNKAVDRKEKQLEEEKSRDRVQMEQFKVCVFYNFFFKEETWIVDASIWKKGRRGNIWSSSGSTE